MKIRRTTKVARVKLSAACHTSQADIERIVNGAPVPADAPKWQVDTRPQRRRKP
jgi:hypothetical protein